MKVLFVIFRLFLSKSKEFLSFLCNFVPITLKYRNYVEIVVEALVVAKTS